jgi:hypothetical protein
MSRTRKHLGLDRHSSFVAVEARRWLDQFLSPMRYEGVATLLDGNIHLYRLDGNAGIGLLAESSEQLSGRPGVYRDRISAWVLRPVDRKAFVIDVELHSWDAGTEASITGDRQWLEVPKRQLYAERDRRTALVGDELDRSTVTEIDPGDAPDLRIGLPAARLRALAERYQPALIDTPQPGPAGSPRRRLSWPVLERRLAKALAAMPPETFLILKTSSKEPEYYVQFAHGTDVFRAEAVASGNLPSSSPLRREQADRIHELGWAFPDAAATNRNAFLDYSVPPPAPDIARLAIETLQSVYGVEDPSDLRVQTGAFDGRTPRLPSLGLQSDVEPSSPRERSQSGSPPKPAAALRKELEGALASWLGVAQVRPDADGDYPIRSGSSLCFVRLVGGVPPALTIFSPILDGVAVTPALREALDEINAGVRYGRVFTAGGAVIVALAIPAMDLTPEHVAFACTELGSLADHLDDVLHGRFGGHLAFETSPKLMN